ncbi:MAG: hypothetical protein H0U15_06925 [Geodermatophilaceae bacterium]|nr:hypothetical protein [Geodermatophilaceae bacterium]
MGALDEGHRQLLARLSVFRGGFTLTAAAAAGGVNVEAALGCKARQVDRSGSGGASGQPLLGTLRHP